MDRAEKYQGLCESVNSLKDRLKRMIQESGPISIAAYMDLCLHDRQHGYYATRPGLGDDFITAPEISQIFGELIGLWLAHEWQALGAPRAFTLIEVGPGRGTLMADALRAAASVEGFSAAAQLHFIEPSPVLRAALTERFAERSPVFLDQLADLPLDAPILLVANEWLDCLPVQQYMRVGDAWHERVIGLSDEGELQFGLNATALPPEIELGGKVEALEIQPGLKTLTESLKPIFEATRGRALFIDYGPANAIPDDTLRSYQKGEQIDPLAAPGASDLTCDVDFARLARLATQNGFSVSGPVSQSALLLKLGAEARLNQLAMAHPETAEALYHGIRKLTDPAEMGERFQALCLSSANLPAPAAF
ncbi:MAG: SAM-dependent methyltransferase [Hyphomonadaceae bacterium]|nr:SAM-dependent methyltransferase [Hyphomonadaceae bacterium]